MTAPSKPLLMPVATCCEQFEIKNVFLREQKHTAPETPRFQGLYAKKYPVYLNRLIRSNHAVPVALLNVKRMINLVYAAGAVKLSLACFHV